MRYAAPILHISHWLARGWVAHPTDFRCDGASFRECLLAFRLARLDTDRRHITVHCVACRLSDAGYRRHLLVRACAHLVPIRYGQYRLCDHRLSRFDRAGSARARWLFGGRIPIWASCDLHTAALTSHSVELNVVLNFVTGVSGSECYAELEILLWLLI